MNYIDIYTFLIVKGSFYDVFLSILLVWLRTGLDVPHPKERVEVTEDQKRIIRDTWPLVNCHLSENGILVYLHVFQLHSDIKPVFHMGNVPFDQLAAQPGLKVLLFVWQ